MAFILHTAKRSDNGQWITGFYMEHRPFIDTKGYIKDRNINGPVRWIEVDISTVKPIKEKQIP